METHGLILTVIRGLYKLSVFLGLVFSVRAMVTHWIVVPSKREGILQSRSGDWIGV
jgi:hypothetical protein